MANHANFLFTSDLAVDRVIYAVSGTYLVPNDTTAGSGAGRQTIAHGQTEAFVPVISYSEDGTNWYSNGQYEVYYDATFALYFPRVWAIASADAMNVYIDWQSGRIGNKTVQYRINGIALDV